MQMVVWHNHPSPEHVRATAVVVPQEGLVDTATRGAPDKGQCLTIYSEAFCCNTVALMIPEKSQSIACLLT